jgi:hypothetical protein
VFSFVKVSTTSFVITGQLHNPPFGEDIQLKIMEFGDFSSLVVEYPDYNSLGEVLTKVIDFKASSGSMEGM